MLSMGQFSQRGGVHRIVAFEVLNLHRQERFPRRRNSLEKKKKVRGYFIRELASGLDYLGYTDECLVGFSAC